jgi:hypothetical protein
MTFALLNGVKVFSISKYLGEQWCYASTQFCGNLKRITFSVVKRNFSPSFDKPGNILIETKLLSKSTSNFFVMKHYCIKNPLMGDFVFRMKVTAQGNIREFKKNRVCTS